MLQSHKNLVVHAVAVDLRGRFNAVSVDALYRCRYLCVGRLEFLDHVFLVCLLVFCHVSSFSRKEEYFVVREFWRIFGHFLLFGFLDELWGEFIQTSETAFPFLPECQQLVPVFLDPLLPLSLVLPGLMLLLVSFGNFLFKVKPVSDGHGVAKLIFRAGENYRSRLFEDLGLFGRFTSKRLSRLPLDPFLSLYGPHVELRDVELLELGFTDVVLNACNGLKFRNL